MSRSLRKCNRIRRKHESRAAFVLNLRDHEKRVARWSKAGNLHKLKETRFYVRRFGKALT